MICPLKMGNQKKKKKVGVKFELSAQVVSSPCQEGMVQELRGLSPG
jgi:hypothetical protein